MLELLKQWLPIYSAVITTGLLVAVGEMLRTVIRSKDSTIENLKQQVEYWKSQSVATVHAANKALREEIDELRRKAEAEHAQKEARIKELQESIERLEVEQPESSRLKESFKLFANSYLTSLSGPAPSGQAAEIIDSVSARLADRFPQWKDEVQVSLTGAALFRMKNSE